jgi:hypothetical protein
MLHEVRWRIHIDAPDRLSAAMQAREMQLDPNSLATVFDVAGGPRPVSRIDLSAPFAYSVAEKTLVDALSFDGTTPLTGSKSLADLRSAYPDLAVGPIHEAQRRIADTYIEAPKEIDRDEFVRALGCMPPVDWVQLPRESTFKLSELIYGDIARIYARLGKEYFALKDRCTLTHDQIIARIRTWKSQQPNATATPQAPTETQS